jgi:hypothetical protein
VQADEVTRNGMASASSRQVKTITGLTRTIAASRATAVAACESRRPARIRFQEAWVTAAARANASASSGTR